MKLTALALRMARSVTKQDVARWKQDLRRMTKIYRSVDPNAPNAVELLVEKSKLFVIFAKNFHDWVYYSLLQKKDPKDENWAEKQVREKAWTAYIGLPTSREMSWDYKTDQHVPDPYKLAQEREKTIARYNRYFKEAFKAIEEYLDYEGGSLQRREMTETTTVGPFKVLIRTKGATPGRQEALDTFLRNLSNVGKQIEKAGFPQAVKNLTVVADFNRKDLVAGQYFPANDELRVYPLGFYSNTFVHECGHRFYFRTLPGKARTYWDHVLSGRQFEITEKDIRSFLDKYVKPGMLDYKLIRERKDIVRRNESDPELLAKFLYLAEHSPLYTDNIDKVLEHHLKANKGDRVNLEELTDYGATNPMEAFAEAFTEYVAKGPRALKPWMRSFFVRICRAGGAKIKAAKTEKKTAC